MNDMHDTVFFSSFLLLVYFVGEPSDERGRSWRIGLLFFVFRGFVHLTLFPPPEKCTAVVIVALPGFPILMCDRTSLDTK